MMNLVEDIYMIKGLKTKYYIWDNIVLPYLRMPRSMSEVVTIVSEWVNQSILMKCHYNLKSW
jgi:hypothetical protein